ncbi:MAG: YceD family protein [Candidatus Aphodosoma sp.]
MTDAGHVQYQLQLKTLPEGDFEYHYHLDDGFFSGADALDIKHGSVDADVVVHKTSLSIGIDIALSGCVDVICDRCLEMMSVPVRFEDSLSVRFGPEYSEDDDNMIVIPEDEGVFDISWLLYEYVELSLPMIHVHPEGECNPVMIGIIDNLSAEKQVKEENDEVDPRWVALKNILNN